MAPKVQPDHKPDPKKPAANKPAAAKPAANKPAATRPGSKKPGTRRPGPRQTPAGEPPRLLILATVVGLYAMAPGIYLDGLKVKPGAEIVDHVVPGLAVLAMVGVALLWGLRSVTVMAVSGLVVLLAGFWMVLTHIGLFHQALDSKVSWGIAAYHCSTAVLVFVLGMTWAWRYRQGLGD